MAADRLPPSANPSHDTDSDPDPEDEEFEEEEAEDVDQEVGKEQDTESEANSEEEDEVEEENEANERFEAEPDEREQEEESSEKTMSQVRGIDYGSDADSGKTVPSPSPSGFCVNENSLGKKRVAESQQGKSKKSKKEKKKGENENVGVGSVAFEEDRLKNSDAFGDSALGEDKVKRSVQRIWGPEDELMIVKGMLDYKEKTGVDFNSNLDAFYQFIKGQLNAVVDKTQLVNKIRKLKEKFRDNAAKEVNGGELVFLKSHEADVYKYSKKVWGGKAVARSKSKSRTEKEVAADLTVMELDNVLVLPVPGLELSKKEGNGVNATSASRVAKVVKKPKVVEKIEFVGEDLEVKDSVIPMPLLVEGLMFEKGLELVEKSKRDALNEKWTKYQMDAAQLYLRRLGLIKEQTELVLDALKSNT